MLDHVVGLAEVEAALLGGELTVSEIDPRRGLVFEDAREQYEALVEERILPFAINHVSRLSISFGKDSLLMLNLFVEAHRRAKERGITLTGPLIAIHIDTRIESPVMHMFAMRQMRLLKAYLERHGIEHRLIIASPEDRYSWPVMYCSGLKLMTVGASASADCSIVLKQDPMKKVERALAREFPAIVSVTGVRLDESTSRAQSIREVGLDTAQVVCRGNQRDYAPIVDLATDQVWHILRCLGEGAAREYGDSLPHWDTSIFYLRRMYLDQEESSCSMGGSSPLPSKSGCGGSQLRSGCALCTVVNTDKQAEKLTDLPQFPQLANLLALRNWLSNNFSNMRYRRFLARKPSDDGYLKLQANTQNEEWISTVLRWLLQCDRDEQRRAAMFNESLLTGAWQQDAGVQAIITDPKLTPAQRVEWLRWYVTDMAEPTFELVTPTQLLLIDALVSRDGYRLPPFFALGLWREVHHQGVTVPYPALDGERVKDPIPAPVYYPLGQDPELLSLAHIEATGTFERYLADLASLSFGGCGGATKQVRREVATTPVCYDGVEGATVSGWFGDTVTVPLVEQAEEGECGYTVDADAAQWITGPMISDYLGELGHLECRNSVARRRLLSEGVLRLSVQAQRNCARLMARADLFERAGMSDLEDGNPALLAQCISQEEHERQLAGQSATQLPAAVVTRMVSVTEQWADLEQAVESVVALHGKLERRRQVVTFTLGQMGQGFRFDGIAYGELQQVLAQQLQAITLLVSKPERLLTLLPSTASLLHGRGRDQNMRLRQLQQRTLQSLGLHRLEALAALESAVMEREEAIEAGLNPVFVAGGGMGFIKDVAQARAYVERLTRLHSHTRLPKAS